MLLKKNLRRILGENLTEIYRWKPAAQPLKAEAFNKELSSIVADGQPQMVTRLGVSEADAVLNYLEIRNNNRENRVLLRWLHKFHGSRSQWSDKTLRLLVDNAGFFPHCSEAANRFAERFLDDFAQANFVGVWGFVPGEQFLIRRQCPSAVQFEPGALEPFYFSEPWSRSLAGRKVLVLHPFVESISAQYRKRDRLFADPQVLPEFELLTVRAVQSLGGAAEKFANWFEALAFMQRQIDRTKFDVALVGAGSYGVPLCAHIKKLGKIAIHIGGALQIMFGIKGRRWDKMPEVRRFYNDAWVRPSSSEMWPTADLVEQGCYW